MWTISSFSKFNTHPLSLMNRNNIQTTLSLACTITSCMRLYLNHVIYRVLKILLLFTLLLLPMFGIGAVHLVLPLSLGSHAMASTITMYVTLTYAYTHEKLLKILESAAWRSFRRCLLWKKMAEQPISLKW